MVFVSAKKAYTLTHEVEEWKTIHNHHRPSPHHHLRIYKTQETKEMLKKTM